MPKHAAGGKITRSHTTIIDGAEDVVEIAKKLPEVSKISLGVIKQIGTGKRKILFTEIPAGFLVKIRGGVTVQEIWIHTSDRPKTREALFRSFWLER